MQTKKSHYRLRVCKDSNGIIQLVFGNEDVDPTFEIISDHDVSETIEVVDHVK